MQDSLTTNIVNPKGIGYHGETSPAYINGLFERLCLWKGSEVGRRGEKKKEVQGVDRSGSRPTLKEEITTDISVVGWVRACRDSTETI